MFVLVVVVFVRVVESNERYRGIVVVVVGAIVEKASVDDAQRVTSITVVAERSHPIDGVLWMEGGVIVPVSHLSIISFRLFSSLLLVCLGSRQSPCSVFVTKGRRRRSVCLECFSSSNHCSNSSSVVPQVMGSRGRLWSQQQRDTTIKNSW